MSEYLKSFLLAKKNYKNQKLLLMKKYKPAEKNINYSYIDSISYNLIENMTMFKNKEVNKNGLNINLLCNISLFFSKSKIDQKKIKSNNNKKIMKIIRNVLYKVSAYISQLIELHV